MIQYVPVNGVYDQMFPTNAAAGNAVAPSGAFGTDDIQIYKDHSNTPRSSSAGITVTSPVNGVVGLHRVSVDISDNTSAAGSLDMDDLAADVDATETRVTTALPNAAPNAAGGLLITTAGSLDMDDLAADVDATETRVTTALPNAAPQAAGGLITSAA